MAGGLISKPPDIESRFGTERPNTQPGQKRNIHTILPDSSRQRQPRNSGENSLRDIFETPLESALTQTLCRIAPAG